MALVRGSLQSEVDPALHRWVLTLEQIDVAVQLPDPERHKHRGVAPAGRSGQVRDELALALRRVVGVGDQVRHAAVLPLVGRQVAQPPRAEASDVVEESGGVNEQLPIAGPAGAFAVRAVGGDLAGVAPEAQHRGFVERVAPLVTAPDPPGADQIRLDHDAVDVVRRQVGRALDPDELEPVGGVARLEVARVGSEAHDLVGLARREWLPGREVDPGDVPEVDITVGTEELAVPQVYFVSGWAEDAPLEPDPAVDVGAEVDDLPARIETRDVTRRERLDAARWWPR